MASYNDFASVYDLMTRNIDYHKRASYFDSIIQQYSKKRGILLDLACGTGSLSEEFASLGYDVIGVDSSEDMLNQAMEKKYHSKNNIIYLCQKMQELDLYGTVDVTVCALDSINHITDAKILQDSFERVSLFTNPGGLFLFDANTPYKHQKILADHSFIYDYDDVYLAWQNETSGDLTSIYIDIFTQNSDGTYMRSEESFQERAYYSEDLKRMLQIAGMKLLAIYDEDSFRPPTETSQRLIYVAQK